MQKYLEYTDFDGSGFVPVMAAVTTAVPAFWSLLLFVFWIAINGASYFAILKLTAKKRFFHTFLSTTFIMFVASIIVAAQNTSTITYLSGYWVAFYLLMTLIGYYLLENYK